MSDKDDKKKDDVKKAAIDALSRPKAKKKSIGAKSSKSPKKSKSDQKTENSAKKVKKNVKKSTGSSLPEKGSAEAEAHKQAAKAADMRLSEPDRPLPNKGSAEAAVHKMASEAVSGNKTGSTPHKSVGGTGIGFLFLVLILPLAIVGGLYAYATYVQEKDAKSTQLASGKTSDKTSGSKAASTSTAKKPDANAKTPSASIKAAPLKAAAPKSKPASGTPKTAVAAKTAKAGSKKVHWDYKKLDWASLDPAFKTCGDGTSQSPIDIRAAGGGAAGPGFQFNYFPSNGKVINNGHAVQVDLDKPAAGSGNQLLVNGKPYDLVQFHFHTPSENRINGQSFPMEAHLVHKNAQGQLAVVAVMIAAGGANPLIDRMPIPANKGDYSTSGGPNINPALLLPNDRRSFTFTGSLTAPPCTEGVGWIVLKTPLSVSAATLAKFHKVMGKNNRPVQPANGRKIFSSN